MLVSFFCGNHSWSLQGYEDHKLYMILSLAFLSNCLTRGSIDSLSLKCTPSCGTCGTGYNTLYENVAHLIICSAEKLYSV